MQKQEQQEEEVEEHTKAWNFSSPAHSFCVYDRGREALIAIRYKKTQWTGERGEEKGVNDKIYNNISSIFIRLQFSLRQACDLFHKKEKFLSPPQQLSS